MSIYRLLTGEYPPAGTQARLPPQALNPRVVRELVELLERILAEDPQARGYAGEVAQAADSAAEHAGPEADVPLFEAPPAAGAPEARPAPAGTRPLTRSKAVQAVFAAALACALISLSQGRHEPSEEAYEGAWAEAWGEQESPDGGTRGLGAEVQSAQGEAQQVHAASPSSITVEMPKLPLDGQRRPPCGQSMEVVIHGACWKQQADLKPPCEDYFVWRGGCYLPVMKRVRVPTTGK